VNKKLGWFLHFGTKTFIMYFFKNNRAAGILYISNAALSAFMSSFPTKVYFK